MKVIVNDRTFDYPQSGPFALFMLRRHMAMVTWMPPNAKVIVDGYAVEEEAGVCINRDSVVEFYTGVPSTLLPPKLSAVRSIDDEWSV